MSAGESLQTLLDKAEAALKKARQAAEQSHNHSRTVSTKRP
jgi:hypothetical protein